MEFVTYAIDKIKHDKWSPDAVSGYVKLHGLECQHWYVNNLVDDNYKE